MMMQVSEQRITRLCRYCIASADMYYCEVDQREVCVCNDPAKGLRIWGEIPGEGAITSVTLCQIFLEYAMYCQTWRDSSQAHCAMQKFGECLGAALARYVQDNISLEQTTNRGAYALECVLKSMNAHFTIEQVGPELHFVVTGCQLQETAEQTRLIVTPASRSVAVEKPSAARRIRCSPVPLVSIKPTNSPPTIGKAISSVRTHS